MQQENRIVTGVIWKEMLIFFIPILIGTFFQQLYNTVDAIIVGRFAGKVALSAVGGSTSQITMLVVGFFVGLSSGCTVVISQLYGAKDEETLSKALHTTYAVALIGGILIGIAGILAARPLLVLMNTPEEIMEPSLGYMRIYFGGLIFNLIYNMGSGILRAVGESRKPLIYLIICSLVNVVLDIIFVGFLKMGAVGAAIATIMAMAVSAVLVTWTLMYRTLQLKLIPKEIHLHPGIFVQMIRIGVPAGVTSVLYGISNMIIQTALNNLGVDTMAAWTAFGKIDSFFWMVNQAFGLTVATFAGINFGAGKPERIRKSLRCGMLMDFMCAAVITSIVYFGSGVLFQLFTADPAVIATGLRMVHVITPAYFLFIFIELFSSTLRAEGYVAVPTVFSLTCICLLRVIWILIIVPNGTLEQIIVSYPLTWAISAVLNTGYYFYKQKKVYAFMAEKRSLT